MPKSKLMRIILVAGSVLIIIGVALMAWMIATADERGVIDVDLGEGEAEALVFEDLSLVPGESCEYIVRLKEGAVSKYDLELDFDDVDPEKTLKHYARVKIVIDGEIIYDELLKDAFEKDKIILPVDFDENQNTELKIVCYLPIDVGNEAKNAEAAFKLLLKASNE